MARVTPTVSVLALVLAGALLSTAAAAPRKNETERRGLDLLPSKRALSLTRGHKSAATPTMAAAAVTVDDVGDVDSFGRNLTWLGLTQSVVTLDSACDPASTEPCQVINPAPGSTTNFSFTDMAHISLPGKATKSLMCYWLSPVINVTYSNPTAANAVSLLRYNPTLTIENPVLADPSLIDPTTGAPFNGHLTTSMTSSEIYQVPLPPGTTITERYRDSAVCIAGFINRRTLTDTFGLSDAQVTEFFKKPTTVRMNISGAARGVSFASIILGFRIIGD
ncbi:hypothetical protein DWG18_10980 [Lysobacter sp. TY2-98]|uniref:hypothetical protein n=1 Tax=Lysobacter sp. TY2-98 TaxID=2290922 RepID=UPI000E2017DF|nr:hypothetical protein [Lysobacter sp. TY2-98]AXK72749.1 hypothetical protein DWG18_10980 [Lysobacter sp. TY2-98]